MRLLIVDDEEGFRDHLGQLFAEEGYQVVTAASGEQAVAELGRCRPDIVITDIVMPDGDGFFVLQQVREQGLKCPVIVVTAYASQESAVKALRLGAYDYVSKPFDLGVLLAAVNRAAEYCRLQQAVDEGRKEVAAQVSATSALYDTALDLVSSLSLPQVLESLLSRAVALLHAGGGNVSLYDEAERQLTVAASYGPWGDFTGRSLALGEGLTGQVAQSGRSLCVDDYLGWEGRLSWYEGTDLGSVIGVPLMVQDRVVGVLNIADGAQRGGFSKADKDLLLRLAPLAALAIEHARLYAEAERNWGEHRYLREIAHAFNSTLDLDEVLTLVMTRTSELLGIEAGSVALLTDDRQRLVFRASVGQGAEVVKGLTMPASEGLVGWVVSHGESLLVPDVTQDPRHYGRVDAKSGFKTRSILCVPLAAKGTVIGAIELLNKVSGPFDADDLRLTEALALSAATAIEKAQHFQREKQALEQLRQAQDDLVRAQRLVVLGQIGVTVRHEVNNPLTAVLGNADWLLQELAGLEGEALSALQAVRANALRIRDIVKKLGDLQTDRVTEYVRGIQMIDIHNQDAGGETEGMF